MAVMATEQAQEVQMEGKSVDGPAKAAVNGRASSTEPKDDAARPEVNGNGHGNSDDKETGSPSAEDTKDIANQDAFSSNQALSTKSDDAPNDQAEPVAKESEKEDTVMEEVEEGSKEQPKEEAKEEGKVKEESPAAEESKDIDMEDADSAEKVTTDADTKPDTPADKADDAAETDALAKPDEQTTDSEKPTKTEVNGTGEDTEAKSPSADDDLGGARISQLAIDKEGEPSESQPAADVAMTDAPQSSSSQGTKVARGREEDEDEEPVAKRARTDTDGEEASESAPPVADKPSTGAPALDSIPRWLDSSFDKLIINEHMRKAYRHILALAKKTTGGMNFRDSVEKLWPGLWEQYRAVVDKPMDLGEIDRRMRDGKYATVGEFRDDLGLIYINCVKFNGIENTLVTAAQQTLTTVWQRILDVKIDEPVSKPAKPIPSRHEPRHKPPPTPVAPPPPRRQSQSQSAVLSPTDPAAEQAYAVPPGGVPQIRRASTLSEGNRPKRAIQTPKNKDIDYSSKPTRKHLKPELQFCEEVLSELMHPKHVLYNQPFLEPVDPVFHKIPTYFNVIKKPMDLGTISKKLGAGEYQSAKQFDADVKLTFSNCYKFNGYDSPVSQAAAGLEKIHKQQWETKSQWLASHAPKASPTAASNHNSDAESEDEAGAAPEPQAVSSANNATIAMLQAKMKEEMQKLTDMFTDPNPNQALITLQQNVVKTVQEALLQEKQVAASHTPAPKATKAKSAKPAKTKPVKESISKRASTGVPKKSAAAPPKKKRKLTDEERAQIPDAIDRLQEPEVNQAIELIKRDTGQAENGDGELELDLDMLSDDVLVKLWNLCKKALPDLFTDPTVTSSPPAPSKKAARPNKPKAKHKPMSATEQDRKIEELRAVEARFKGGQSSQQSAPAEQQSLPAHDSSSDDDESSEEE